MIRKLYIGLVILLLSNSTMVFSAGKTPGGNLLVGVAAGLRKDFKAVCHRAKANAIRQVKTICGRTKRELNFTNVGCFYPKIKAGQNITVNYKIRYKCQSNPAAFPRKPERKNNLRNLD